MLTVMVCCGYCGQQATMKIVSNPEFVCSEHGLEFWTGLLVYVKDHSAACVKHEPPCTCMSCEELSASYLRALAIAEAEEKSNASDRRAFAIASAGPSPEESEHFSISLAS
jgi:hypothetical protein